MFHESELKQVQSVTVRTDSAEEVQAMHALIQRWAMNGWTVKNISQFSHSEGQFGELGFQHSSYSTILFEKEDASLCPICNKVVNDVKLHTEWHIKENRPLPKLCTKCGREVNPSASYCPSCGNQLSRP